MKAKVSFLFLMVVLFSITLLCFGITFEHNMKKYPQFTDVEYNMMNDPLNTYVLDKYNVQSYGNPHGSFMVSPTGKMTNSNGSKGEYKYLGYNYIGNEITNDLFFSNPSNEGNVFLNGYNDKSIEWVASTEFYNSWAQLLTKPFLENYIANVKFRDADYPNGTNPNTGQSLKDIFGNDYKMKSKILTVPDQGTNGTVYMEYYKNGDWNWNTVEIPALPEVVCIVKATPDKPNISGKEDINVTIDTSESYWTFGDEHKKNFTNRYYWASLTEPSGGGAPDKNDRHVITVHDVTPNSTIIVKARVFSEEVSQFGYSGYAEAIVYVPIGEIDAPTMGSDVSYQNTKPSTNTIVKADQRDNERFDVSLGIPTGETVYSEIITTDYLYRLTAQQATGSVDYSVTVNHPDEKGKPETSTESFTRSYSYWRITSLEVYGIKDATVTNGALPGGKITLSPSAAYHVPNVVFTDVASHVNTGSTSITINSDSTDPDEIKSAARDALPNLTSSNDILSINGMTIMTANTFTPENLSSSLASRDSLYQSGFRIPASVRNSTYSTAGTITYTRTFAYNPKGGQEMTFVLTGNSVSVHTPVYTEFSVSSDDIHNQKPEPAEGLSALVLGRSFSIDITNTGTHRNIPGYGTRDYTAYIKDREIRFGFDTYFGADMTGKYLKANTWYSLEGLGVNKSARQITFYTPRWVDEGTYEVEVRTLAANYTSGASAQQNANTDPYRYAAYDASQVEVSGRVYDFAVTDIDDPAWETFFRVTAGKPDPTGNIFYVGPNNINGDANPSTKYLLPVMPGKNDKQGYGDRAVKLGYAYKFDIKTMGNYYDEHDYLQILPAFYYVDSSGKNRQEVDLYYSTTSKPLIRVGSTDDTLTQSMKLNFTYRDINPSEFINTAEAMFNLRGGIKTYTLDKFKEAFPKVSQNGIIISKYYKVLLSEPVRSFVGPISNLPAGISRYKALASVQKWYGQYFLPSDCLAVPKGTDLTKEKDITKSSPVFLKNGYIIVNFKNIAVINDDNFDHPSLKYAGKTGDGWSLEGFDINQKGWELAPGDVFVYYTDKRSTDDYYGAGTH